jgi:hypothetical protein
MAKFANKQKLRKSKRPWVGVQLHFGQPFSLSNPTKKITINDIKTAFSKIKNVIDVDGVYIGFSVDPFFYDYTIDIVHELGAKAYLWYGVLADIGEDINVPQNAYMINYLGEINSPWGQIQSENFQFICPNHSLVKDVLIPRSINIVEKHDFDGIFLDRIRFPSMVNGLENNFCCFCELCQKKASEYGYDLLKFKNSILKIIKNIKNATEYDLIHVGNVLKAGSLFDLLYLDDDLSEFYKFRERCITSIVKDISSEMRQRDKEVGLDLFSPSLSPFVSQNYSQLCKYCDWIKSMSYCYAKGPASLPLEIISIIEILQILNKNFAYESLEVLISDVLGIENFFISHKDKKIGPIFDILINEMYKARKLYKVKRPIYLGFEAVNLPGICDVGQREMEQYLQVLINGKLDGYILSWTLPLISDENIKVFANYMSNFES